MLAHLHENHTKIVAPAGAEDCAAGKQHGQQTAQKKYFQTNETTSVHRARASVPKKSRTRDPAVTASALAAAHTTTLTSSAERPISSIRAGATLALSACSRKVQTGSSDLMRHVTGATTATE